MQGCDEPKNSKLSDRKSEQQAVLLGGKVLDGMSVNSCLHVASCLIQCYVLRCRCVCVSHSSPLHAWWLVGLLHC